MAAGLRTTTRHAWRMRVSLPFSKGITDEVLAFTGGQCDLDAEGAVLHAGRLVEQVQATCRNGAAVLGELHLPPLAAVFARSFILVREAGEEAQAHEALAAACPGSELSTVLVPHFYYEGMRAETEFVAATAAAPVHYLSTARHRAAGAVAAWSQAWQDLQQRCERRGCSMQRLARLTTYWRGSTPAEWAQLQSWRSGQLPAGPWVLTDLFEPPLQDGHEVHLDAVMAAAPAAAVSSDTGTAVAVRSGTVLLSGTITDPAAGGLLDQTRSCMDRVRRLLARAGIDFTHVMKMSTYYVAGAADHELHENLSIRASHFTSPGPASTGIPVQGLPDGARIAIEFTGRLPA
jgi:enamine deaminase RidA (YjgF/YER057c/UK114 family)